MHLLGVDSPLEYKIATNGMTVQLPQHKPGEFAFVFKIELEK